MALPGLPRPKNKLIETMTSWLVFVFLLLVASASSTGLLAANPAPESGSQPQIEKHIKLEVPGAAADQTGAGRMPAVPGVEQGSNGDKKAGAGVPPAVPGAEQSSNSDGTATSAGGTQVVAGQEPTGIAGLEPAIITAAEEARKERELKAVEHLFLSHKYALRWDLDLAEVELQEAINLMPDLRVVHRDYCLLAIAKGELGLAVAEFMLATGIGDPIPYTEAESSLLNLRAAKLHYRKAISYANEKRWPSAISELDLADQYAPFNPNIKRSLAFAYASAGQFDKAEQSYKDTFELAPSDGFSRADFAFLLSEEGKKDNAVDQMAKAVKLQPESPALHVDLAWFAENKGDIKKASAEIQDAVRLSPDHAGLWTHLGRLLEKLDKTAEAKQAYQKAIAIDPLQPDAKTALSRLSDASGAKPSE
jgi:Flp pilus assembly protein TadD